MQPPNKMPRTNANAMGKPICIMYANIIAQKGNIPDTEISVPPVIMTIVIPRAIIASIIKLLIRISKFAQVKKYLVVVPITITVVRIITISTI